MFGLWVLDVLFGSVFCVSWKLFRAPVTPDADLSEFLFEWSERVTVFLFIQQIVASHFHVFFLQNVHVWCVCVYLC